MSKWQIPLFDVKFNPEEIAAVSNVLKSSWLTMGEITEKFENAFAKFLGVKHAFAVTNGTAALHIACQLMGLRQGDEVICPALTFIASSNCVVYTGAKPVFADIVAPHNLNIAPGDIKKKISPKTKGIMVVHYAGYPCQMDEILEIARKHKLFVIEDAAHAVGAHYKGKACGTIGDIGCFSFFSNKNLITGEGGMIATNNSRLAQRIGLLRSHGMTSQTLDRHKGHAFSYDVVDLGYNYRIDEIRSSMGLAQLKNLGNNNKKRARIVELYRRHLKNVKQITIPFVNLDKKSKGANHIFPIILTKKVNRQNFMAYLKRNGVQSSIHYPPIHKFKFYRNRTEYKDIILPITEDIAEREVTLPLYPSMKQKDVCYICDLIIKYF